MTGAATRLEDWIKNEIIEASAGMGFRVANILVDGRKQTDAASLMAIINMQKGDPLFSFDPHSARDMIEKLSWVKTAYIERRLPGTIYIALEERTPIALWQRDGKLSVIDEEGAVLTDEAGRFAHLMILVGDDVPAHADEFVSLMKAEPELAAHIEAAVLVSGRRWDLKMKNGVMVKLPEEETGLALRRLAKAQEEDSLLQKDITAIDLREEGRMIVQTRPGAVQDYLDGIAPASGGNI